MNIATSWSTATGTRAAFDQAMTRLHDRMGGYPGYLLVYFTESYPAEELHAALAMLPPSVKVQGCSSCLGVMTEEGMHAEDGRALGLLGIRDELGAYGVGAAALAGDPRAAARAALEAALADSGRPGELPDIVWLNAAPGHEEAVLQGVCDVVGRNVPVLGGSAGDNHVAGAWRLLTRQGAAGDAVVVSVMMPALHVSSSFQSGYLPTTSSGIVTSATGRIVHAIDGRPAAAVYREWTGSLLDGVPAAGGNVLSLTTLAPLGRMLGTLGEVPFYTLSHPDALLADGSLSLFAEVAAGEQLVLMTGSKERLVARAGRVARSAIDLGGFAAEAILGAVVVYCAGCMLTVQDRLPDVVAELNNALGGKPFIGIFTFGEQGCMLDGHPSHGNLMISAMVFSE
ncbi:MAG: hypothetical protein A3H93_16725 [Rhodocyclales bacterium RIFCSPLOWO2_02_FULL_63_24]|nr:MAG: hypothetical protein A3H93_16725 [Rhodocyclales bacterium RIFCSPLOWO2_02_FULL_63_24]